HAPDDAAELGDLEARLGCKVVDLAADVLDARALVLDELRPALLAGLRDAVEPGLVELVAVVFVDEILPGDAVAVGQPHELAFEAHQPLVDGIKLLDEALDAVVVELQALDVRDDLLAQLGIGLLLLARALLARDL